MSTTTALNEVHLVNVPLENNYEHTFFFESAATQWAYFSNLFTDFASAYNCSYQRRDKVIRFPQHYDLIKGYNYVVFINEVVLDNGSSRQFKTFAFINKMEYVNDKNTNIYIETDVMQTYLFLANVKQSFVEREHVNDDAFGKHTLDEGLETGEYVNNNKWFWGELTSCDVVIGSTVDPETLEGITGGIYGNIYSGVRYYSYELIDDVTSALQNIATNKDQSAISSLFMAPKFLIPKASGSNYAVKQSAIALTSYSTPFPMKKNLNGYTPKNNKLLCYPYNYLLADVKNGGASTYRWEFFANQTNENGERVVEFCAHGVLTPGCSIIINPLQYKGVPDNHLEGMTMGKFPQCNWATDQYTNWLASTSHTRDMQYFHARVNQVVGMGESIIDALAGSPANVIGNQLGSIQKIEMLNAERADHQKDGNANNGTISQADTVYTSSKVFGAYQYCIRAEYAQKIDRVLSAIGYRTDTMKVPNITGRRNWNYVQTQAVAIQGTIPQEDLQEIKNMFNSGVTFWHNPATFLDYSQNNDII